MNGHRSGISIFSEVRNLFKIFESKFWSCLFIFSPFVVFLVAIYGINKHLKIRLCGLFSDGFDFNIVVLTSCAINLVLISSVGYFYKEVIFKVQNIDSIKESIKNIIGNVEAGKDGDKAAFIDNSVGDLEKIFDHPNCTIRSIHTNLFIIELLLVVTAVSWSIYDFVLISTPTFKIWWQNARFLIGFSISALLIFYILLHGVVLMAQFILRKRLAKCLSEKEIKRKWKRFKAEMQELTSGKISEDVRKLRSSIGVD